MITEEFNLFIVDSNPTIIKNIEKYLDKRFGSILNISSFPNTEAALSAIDKDTKIVIVIDKLQNNTNNNVLDSIKAINSTTKVILLSQNEDIATVMKSYSIGTTGYVVRGSNSWVNITILVNKIINYPVKRIINTFSILQYLAMFLVTFLVMGAVIFMAVRYTIIFE